MLLNTTADSLQIINKTKETASKLTSIEYGSYLNMVVDVILTGGAILGVLWFIFILYKGEDPKDKLMKNPAKSFNIMTALSSLLEVLTLTAASVSRGNPFSTSFSGYFLIAVVEVFMVYFVMIQVGKILADKRFDFKTEWPIALKGFLWIICTFIATTAIYHLYKEAMGATEVIASASNGFFDIFGLKVNHGEVQLELRSIFLIYSTELFMILGIFFEWEKRTGSGSSVYNTHTDDIHKTINNRSNNSNNSNKNTLTREDELKQLINQSAGVVKSAYERELRSLEGN